MEDVPDAAKIAALFALIAVGFVARHGYRTQFTNEKEDQGIVLLWAIFWSVVLNAAFALLGRPIPYAAIEILKTSGVSPANVILVLNLFWAWILGSGYGKVMRSLQIVERDRVQYKVRGWRYLSWIAWRAFFAPKVRLHGALVHDFLANYADQQWVVVELDDRRAYVGYVDRFDQAPARSGDYHLLLGEPKDFDVHTGSHKDAKLCETMLIKADKIRTIRLLTTQKEPLPMESDASLGGRVKRFLLCCPEPRPKPPKKPDPKRSLRGPVADPNRDVKP